MSYVGNALLDTSVLLEKGHVVPGMHVADFGCGKTGHIVFPISTQVGEDGIVYAVDILQDALRSVDKRAKSQGMSNVYTIWSDLERVGKTCIVENSLDLIYIVNVLSIAHNRHAYLEEAQRLLKNKGRIVVVDWVSDALPIAPKQEACVAFENIEQWARMSGFGVQEKFTVGKYHGGVVLYRSV
tara:strand:+ start:418 stop:969 length:552 start_codon:yes stop_codon:yes gene_type:complete